MEAGQDGKAVGELVYQHVHVCMCVRASARIRGVEYYNARIRSQEHAASNQETRTTRWKAYAHGGKGHDD
eukprot:1158201-Pelagomonas_calceolata.AAC.9